MREIRTITVVSDMCESSALTLSFDCSTKEIHNFLRVVTLVTPMQMGLDVRSPNRYVRVY